MRKIPVADTIRAAYRFTFHHLGAIIGLIWLPMVIVTVMGFFVQQHYYAAAADALASNNIASLGPALVSLLLYFIAALLLYAVMYVPVVQLALGARREGVLVHFAFGPAEWRLFRALLGLIAFLVLPIAIARLLFIGAGMLAQSLHVAPPFATIGPELVEVLADLAVLYIGLRFAFLLPAVAATEDGPVLPRSWSLSAGNFWRILAVMLATIGPVVLVAAVAEMLLEGHGSLTPAISNTTASAAVQLHNMSANMPISQSLGFLIAPLLLGLACSSSAFALSALKDGAHDGEET
jgi:hypothetical protein